MKFTKYILPTFLGIFLFTGTVLAVQITVPSASGKGFLLQSSTTGQYIPTSLNAGTNITISTTTNSITISAAAGTGVFPFTSVAGYNSTSTTLGLLNGLFSTASSTFSGNFYLPSLSQGFTGIGTNGQVYSFATSSIKTSQLTNDAGFTTNAGTVTAVSVASANGFTGSSSGGATPALTLSTSISGILKGNGTAISAASNGTDYTLITANTCGAGNHVSAISAAGAITCSADTGGLSSYDAFTHPAAGQSATTSLMLFTGNASSTLFSTGQAWFGKTATTSIDGTGNVVLNSSAFIKDGSNILMGGNGTNTLFRPDSSGGQIQFQSFAGSNNSVFLDNGNAGIGSTTPTSKLSVVGNGYFDGGSVTANTLVATTSASIPALSNLTSNGFVKTTGGTGALSVDTTTYLSGTVAIANGGTNTTSQTSNGVAYYDGSKITSGSSLTYNGTKLTEPYASSTSNTISGELNIPHSGTVPTMYAGDVYNNTNSTASSSIAFNDGTNTHNLFAVHTVSFPIASSTLSYLGAFVNAANPYVVFGTGSATTTALQCSTSGTAITYASNNTWKGRQTVYMAVGTASGTTTIALTNPLHGSILQSGYCKTDATTPNTLTISADVEDTN